MFLLYIKYKTPMKKTMYGLVFGFLAMFSAISIVPVMATDWWGEPLSVGKDNLVK